jgi:hypothetical protein
LTFSTNDFIVKVMSKKSEYLREVAMSRLAEIGCEQLPPGVVVLIVSGFVERAELRLKRLARREVTVPKIAKLFAQGLATKGETTVSSFGEAGPSNEVSHGP